MRVSSSPTRQGEADSQHQQHERVAGDDHPGDRQPGTRQQRGHRARVVAEQPETDGQQSHQDSRAEDGAHLSGAVRVEPGDQRAQHPGEGRGGQHTGQERDPEAGACLEQLEQHHGAERADRRLSDVQDTGHPVQKDDADADDGVRPSCQQTGDRCLQHVSLSPAA